jgi:hypothetical protein
MKIWLDDQLHDPVAPNRHTPEGWVGCKDDKEFKAAVVRAMESGEGIDEMSFDNDLGEDSLEGHQLLQWLADTYPKVVVSEEITITIHSANSVERQKMEQRLDWWKKNKEEFLEAQNREDPWAALDRK